MPITSRYEGRVLRLSSRGENGWEDLPTALQRAMEQPAFEAGHTLLMVDARTSEAAVTSDELRDIAADFAPLSRRFAAVLLVTSDDLRYGLGRMLAAYVEHLGVEILVFRSMDAADSWIRAHAAP